MRTRWTLAVALAAALAPAATAQAYPFTVKFTEPGPQAFTVPAGVRSVHVVAIGADGGRGGVAPGGNGARVSAELQVAPGQVLWAEVGAPGEGGGAGTAQLPAAGGRGGAPTGGDGGTGGLNQLGVWGGGGGGGGATIVRECGIDRDGTCSPPGILRLVAAGGGGGAAESGGGNGGTPSGAPGQPSGQLAGGGGATPSAGGSSPSAGGAGGIFAGGSAEDVDPEARFWHLESGGGGGGGGYFGGGAGAHGVSSQATGGGGGSSYGPEGATFAAGLNDGAAGSVAFTYEDAIPPEVEIAAPADGATYVGGEPIIARFACRDLAGVVECRGTVANGAEVDSSPGEHTFTVTALDGAGNRREVTTRYTVLGPPVSPGTPALPPPADEDEADEPEVPPPGDTARPTVRLRSFDCGRRTCRAALTLGGDVRRFRVELDGDGRRVVKSGAAQAGARRVLLRRPRGGVYSLTLTAIGPNGATVTVRRTVRP
jgi:hypothetical protein